MLDDMVAVVAACFVLVVPANTLPYHSIVTYHYLVHSYCAPASRPFFTSFPERAPTLNDCHKKKNNFEYRANHGLQRHPQRLMARDQCPQSGAQSLAREQCHTDHLLAVLQEIPSLSFTVVLLVLLVLLGNFFYWVTW